MGLYLVPAPKEVDISAATCMISCLMARNLNLGTLLVITTFNLKKPKFWTSTYETLIFCDFLWNEATLMQRMIVSE